MAGTNLRMLAREVWALAGRQHGLVARDQLLALGASRSWIEHRIARGRLHRVHRGVYAIGRPELTQEGRWMAAVLACGPTAVLSFLTAGAHWRICRAHPGLIDISISAAAARRRPGVHIHRTATLAGHDLTVRDGIPITTPSRTLIDLATILGMHRLEVVVNEANARDLIDPDSLRTTLEERKGQPGVRPLRALIDRHTFRLTESELERRFLRLVREAGMPLPETQADLAGRTDFFWPSLALVVETDGWRYHRTPGRQARDNRRMQAHALAGRTAIRISHHEIRCNPDRVIATLRALVRRGSSAA